MWVWFWLALLLVALATTATLCALTVRDQRAAKRLGDDWARRHPQFFPKG